MSDWLNAFTSSPLFGFSLSLASYCAGQWIHKKLKFTLAHPLLLAILICMGVLLAFRIPVENFAAGGTFISMFLCPVTAALALSVYRKRQLLRKYLFPVLAGCIAGAGTSMGSVYLLCRLFGLDDVLTASLLPKSVTTPIAMSVSEMLGGIPSVSMAAVIITGIAGAIAAPAMIRLFRIDDPIAAGVGIGACSHAMGTSRALEIGETEGAMSSITIGISGIITVAAALFFL